MPRKRNKRPAACPWTFATMFDPVSKAALIDALWMACQLGTDESVEQITAQAASAVLAALRHRADRIPADIVAAAVGRTE
jgi:FixJ family two-component response regulator